MRRDEDYEGRPTRVTIEDVVAAWIIATMSLVMILFAPLF